MAKSPEESRTSSLGRKRKQPPLFSHSSYTPLNDFVVDNEPDSRKRQKTDRDAECIEDDSEPSNSSSSRRGSVASGVSKESGEISTSSAQTLMDGNSDSRESHALKPSARSLSESEPIADRYSLRPRVHTQADLSAESEPEPWNEAMESAEATARRIFPSRNPYEDDEYDRLVAAGCVVLVTIHCNLGQELPSMRSLQVAFAAALQRGKCADLACALPPRWETSDPTVLTYAPRGLRARALLFFRNASAANFALATFHVDYSRAAKTHAPQQATTHRLKRTSPYKPRIDSWADILPKSVDTLINQFAKRAAEQATTARKSSAVDHQHRSSMVETRLASGQLLRNKDYAHIFEVLCHTPDTVMLNHIQHAGLKDAVQQYASTQPPSEFQLARIVFNLSRAGNHITEAKQLMRNAYLSQMNLSNGMEPQEDLQTNRSDVKSNSVAAVRSYRPTMTVSDLKPAILKKLIKAELEAQPQMTVEALVCRRCDDGQPFRKYAVLFMRSWESMCGAFTEIKGKESASQQNVSKQPTSQVIMTNQTTLKVDTSNQTAPNPAVSKQAVVTKDAIKQVETKGVESRLSAITPKSASPVVNNNDTLALDPGLIYELLEYDTIFSRPIGVRDVPQLDHPELFLSIQRDLSSKRYSRVKSALTAYARSTPTSDFAWKLRKSAREVLQGYFSRHYIGSLPPAAEPLQRKIILAGPPNPQPVGREHEVTILSNDDEENAANQVHDYDQDDDHVVAELGDEGEDPGADQSNDYDQDDSHEVAELSDDDEEHGADEAHDYNQDHNHEYLGDLVYHHHDEMDSYSEAEQSDGGVSVGELPSQSTFKQRHFKQGAVISDSASTITRLHELSAPEQALQYRYFALSDPYALIRCLTCGVAGHTPASCPTRICTHCGAVDAHFASACPSYQKCSHCRQRAHDKKTCSRRAVAGGGLADPCDVCGGLGHLEEQCSRLGRRFDPDADDTAAGKKMRAEDMLVGCYNCGSRQHWGADCPKLPHFLRAIPGGHRLWSREYAAKFIQGAEDSLTSGDGGLQRRERAYQLEALDDMHD